MKQESNNEPIDAMATMRLFYRPVVATDDS